MRKGIKRTSTKKEDQIKWDGTAQQMAIEMYFNNEAFNKITYRVGGKTHRERKPSNILEGGGVELKVTKLLKFYRYEKPLFDKIHNRSGKIFTKRENTNLLIAIKSKYILKRYKNPYDYLTQVFGRPEKELRNQTQVLLGKTKPVLFEMKGNKK